MSVKLDISVRMPAAWENLRRWLSPMETRERLDYVGRSVARSLAAYFNKIGRTMHKTARKLGATPTGILNFYEGYPPFSMTGAEINSYRVGSSSVFVEVTGIPFLRRAFGDVRITPKRAHALTIPIHRYAYAKRAEDLERDGWKLFTLGSRRKVEGVRKASGILFGMRGSEGPVPLFRFARSVTLPQDARLLPSSEMVGRWAADALERSLAS